VYEWLKLKLTVKERRMKWLGHILHIGNDRLPKPAVYRKANSTRQKTGLRKKWTDNIQKDLI